MSARNIVRKSVNLIIAQIQANITQCLADTHADQGDSTVNCDTPLLKSYFSYPAQAYRAPAVFVIPNSVDFRLDRGANFMTQTVKMLISVVVEDKRDFLLNLKAWQYQDALHECLQGQELVGGKIKAVVLITGARFSSQASDKSDGADIFRKEVALDCDVEIYESL